MQLLRRRPIGGRSATGGGSDVGVAQDQAVVAPPGGRLIGEAGLMESNKERVGRAIAGEHAPGAVAAVGGWGQANDQQARLRVADARQGAPPVLLFAVGRASCHERPAHAMPRAAGSAGRPSPRPTDHRVRSLGLPRPLASPGLGQHEPQLAGSVNGLAAVVVVGKDEQPLAALGQLVSAWAPIPAALPACRCSRIAPRPPWRSTTSWRCARGSVRRQHLMWPRQPAASATRSAARRRSRSPGAAVAGSQRSLPAANRGCAPRQRHPACPVAGAAA